MPDFMTGYAHEMFDHPAVPGNDGRTHDRSVPQHECLACHDGAHAQYEQDVMEVVNGETQRNGDVYVNDVDGPHTDIPIDSPHWGPTKFLMAWHEHNGHCPHLTGT